MTISDTEATIFFDESLLQILPHRGRAMLIDQVSFNPLLQEVVAMKHLFELGQQVAGFPGFGMDYNFPGFTGIENQGEKQEKNPTDFLFAGHFVGSPILPGHYQDEMACLAGAVLFSCLTDVTKDTLPVVVRKEGIRYKRKALPCDTLYIRAFQPVFQKSFFEFSVEIKNQAGKIIAIYEKIVGTDGSIR